MKVYRVSVYHTVCKLFRTQLKNSKKLNKVEKVTLITTRTTQELFERITVVDTKVGQLTPNLLKLTQTAIKVEKITVKPING